MRDEDIITLMKRLDSNGDGRISYYKFIDATIPIGKEMKYKDKLLSTGEMIKQKVRRSQSPEKQRMPQIIQNETNFVKIIKSNDRRTQTKIANDQKDKSNEIKLEEALEMQNKSAQNISQFEEKSYSKLPEERQSNANRSTAINNSPPLNNSISFMTSTPSPIKQTVEKILNTGINHEAVSMKLNLTNSPMKGMKGNEEEYLAIALKNQLDLDKELEKIRDDLAVKTDFNLMDAFRFFDSNGKGFITSSELNESLQSFDIFSNPTEIYLIMRKYDADGDGLFRSLILNIVSKF